MPLIQASDTGDTMAKVEQVTQYRCTDGKLFDEILQAERHQDELDLSEHVGRLVDDYMSSYGNKRADIVDFIIEHRIKLMSILNGATYDEN
jgi:hypothetical protein